MAGTAERVEGPSSTSPRALTASRERKGVEGVEGPPFSPPTAPSRVGSIRMGKEKGGVAGTAERVEGPSSTSPRARLPRRQGGPGGTDYAGRPATGGRSSQQSFLEVLEAAAAPPGTRLSHQSESRSERLAAVTPRERNRESEVANGVGSEGSARAVDRRERLAAAREHLEACVGPCQDVHWENLVATLVHDSMRWGPEARQAAEESSTWPLRSGWCTWGERRVESRCLAPLHLHGRWSHQTDFHGAARSVSTSRGRARKAPRRARATTLSRTTRSR